MRKNLASIARVSPRSVRGLSLIELMIALVLGLVVVGAAGGVFLANRRVYAASETLNRVQENGRVSFELIARDLREAGGNPCGTGAGDVVNMLKRSSTDWLDGLFVTGIRGYGPGGTYVTDSIDIALNGSSGSGSGKIYRITESSGPSANIELDSTDGLDDGDVVMACNSEKGVIFQVTGTPADNKVQFHKNGGTPGNCASTLQGRPVGPNCDGAGDGAGNAACFKGSALKLNQCGAYMSENSAKSWYTPMLVKAGGVRWYVASNGRGGTSLYRAQLNPSAAGWATAGAGEEIAEGVSALRLGYRLATDPAAGFRPAGEIPAGQWGNVNAVEVAVTAVGVAGNQSANEVKGTDGKALERTFTYVVALRNREVAP